MKYKDANGNKIEIVVRCKMNDYSTHKFSYWVEDVLITQPRKRKPRSIRSELRESYEYRNTPYDKRGEFTKQKYIEASSEEAIKSAIEEEHIKMLDAINPANAGVEFVCR